MKAPDCYKCEIILWGHKCPHEYETLQRDSAAVMVPHRNPGPSCPFVLLDAKDAEIESARKSADYWKQLYDDLLEAYADLREEYRLTTLPELPAERSSGNSGQPPEPETCESAIPIGKRWCGNCQHKSVPIDEPPCYNCEDHAGWQPIKPRRE